VGCRLSEPKNKENMSLYDANSEACQKCLCTTCVLDCDFNDACSGCIEELRDATVYCWKTDEKGKVKEEV